jgi:hypothetical protein
MVREAFYALMRVVDELARIQENTNYGNWDWVKKEVSALEADVERLKNFVKSEKVRKKLDETVKALKEGVKEEHPLYVHIALIFGYKPIVDELIDNIAERVYLEYPKEREEEKLGKAIGD